MSKFWLAGHFLSAYCPGAWYIFDDEPVTASWVLNAASTGTQKRRASASFGNGDIRHLLISTRLEASANLE
ncbi:hypothetical protein FIBSPDRAFT_866326 [Athelia psychrophila]|uniref:Uncharacterized protein n=1 Tax=Athelia psychrophila TaxID=1759441 RepID=A0A166ETK4_9AGAM|nr:hypothetical protein FIBSPDRAFT_866326 [Fibularhizoctonia sp. CBS 109695]